jgi:hypothetical protein
VCQTRKVSSKQDVAQSLFIFIGFFPGKERVRLVRVSLLRTKIGQGLQQESTMESGSDAACVAFGGGLAVERDPAGTSNQPDL